MAQRVKRERVVVENSTPVHFKKGPRTSYDPNKDVKMYDLLHPPIRNKPPTRKGGGTRATWDELINGYKGQSRGQGDVYTFANLIEIEWTLLEEKMGIAHCSEYQKDATKDRCIRDYVVKIGLAEEAPWQPDSEALDTHGLSWVEIISKILQMEPKELPSHSLIDADVIAIRDALDQADLGTILLAIFNKAPRYWKDFLSLNLLANISDKSDMIMPSKMFTTHYGFGKKAQEREGLEVFDLKKLVKPDTTVEDLVALRNKSLTNGKKNVWLVSGFERRVNSIIKEFFASFSNNSKLIGIDEADYAVWKILKDLLSLCGLSNYNPNDKPLVCVMSATGMDKITMGLSEAGFSSKVFDYDLRIIERMTSQQDLELAKLSGDSTLQHVKHKIELEVVYDEYDLAEINNLEENLTGWPLAYSKPNPAWFSGAFDRFFVNELEKDTHNDSYLHDVLNSVILQTLTTNSLYKDVDHDRYLTREVVGVQINTSSLSYKSYDVVVRILHERYGKKWLVIGTKGQKRKTIEKEINNRLRQAHEQKEFVTQGGSYVGYILVAPSWTMLGRSFTEGLIDFTLEAKDGLDGQHDNRSLSDLDKTFNNGLHLDNKEKLLGVSIHLQLNPHADGTMKEVYERWATGSTGPQSKDNIRLYMPVFNHWQLIRNNLVQLKESQIISKLDKSKALGQRALGSANWEVAEKFKRYLLGMRVAKSRTKETLRVGKSIAGSIPGVPIPKTLTKTAIDKDKALMYAALENFGFGVDILARYAIIIDAPKDITLRDLANEVLKYPELKDEFKNELFISLLRWRRLIDVGLFQDQGLKTYELLLEQARNDLT